MGSGGRTQLTVMVEDGRLADAVVPRNSNLAGWQVTKKGWNTTGATAMGGGPRDAGAQGLCLLPAPVLIWQHYSPGLRGR